MIVSANEAAAAISGSSAANAEFIRLVKGANAAVMRVCGRDFERAERTETVEGYGWNDRVDGIVRSYVLMREDPIASVAEVRVDSTSAFATESIVDDLTEFVFDGPRLIWTAGYFPAGRSTVRVKYTAGYWPASDTDAQHTPLMPEDLRDVIIEMIAAKFRRGTGERMKSESLGEYSYTRFDSIDPAHRRVLSLYKRW